MGLHEFLTREERKEKEENLFYEEGRALGMSDEEIEDALNSGMSPDEWLEENEFENYLEQGLDKD